MPRPLSRYLAFVACSLLLGNLAWADTHTAGVPTLSSLPGAAYTVYLDFAGFNFTGTWSSNTPGNTPSFNDTPTTVTFSTIEQNTIKDYWARVANAPVGVLGKHR